jgi:hypothetical protein
MDVEAWDGKFQVGDRVEWVGESQRSVGGPDHGERGWVVDVDPMDDIIKWDERGTESGNYFHPANPEKIRFVRREPDSSKWFTGGTYDTDR